MYTYKLLLVLGVGVLAFADKFQFNRPPLAITRTLSAPSIVSRVSRGQRDSVCTEKNARYPFAGQCDAYTECRNWKSEEMLCPDGLRFNPKSKWNEFPCGYPVEVTCEEGALLQQSQHTKDCPNQYGYYRIGDSKNCGVYSICVEGKGYDLQCPEGLAYNSATYQCEWADLVEDCDPEAFLGFQCPAPTLHQEGVPAAVRNAFYKHESNCLQFYSCAEGKPRLLSCEPGKAFVELTKQCEDIDSVPGCVLRAPI